MSRKLGSKLTKIHKQKISLGVRKNFLMRNPKVEKLRLERLAKTLKGKAPWNAIRAAQKANRLRIGPKHFNWKSDPIFHYRQDGRVEYIYVAPCGTKKIRQNYHTFLVESKIGRKLNNNECIHHINGNPSDNRIENLFICSKQFHGILHWKMSKLYMQEHFGKNKIKEFYKFIRKLNERVV